MAPVQRGLAGIASDAPVVHIVRRPTRAEIEEEAYRNYRRRAYEAVPPKVRAVLASAHAANCDVSFFYAWIRGEVPPEIEFAAQLAGMWRRDDGTWIWSEGGKPPGPVIGCNVIDWTGVGPAVREVCERAEAAGAVVERYDSGKITADSWVNVFADALPAMLAAELKALRFFETENKRFAAHSRVTRLPRLRWEHYVPPVGT